MYVDTDQFNTNHTCVSAIHLRAEVKACSDVAGFGYCSEPVAVDVPLVYSISQPPRPILQQSGSYDLKVTMRPPAFRGAGVPVLVFEDDAYYEVRYRLVNSTKMITENVSAGSHQFVASVQHSAGCPGPPGAEGPMRPTQSEVC